MRKKEKQTLQLCQNHFPDLQAIYLFGSAAGTSQHKIGDIDLALLLPPETARETEKTPFLFSKLKGKLENLFLLPVDLINIRMTTTVFQNEIVESGDRIAVIDTSAADEFEMYTLSLYQQLNRERAAILDQFFTTKRAINL